MNWTLLLRTLGARVAQRHQDRKVRGRRNVWPWVAGMLIVGFPAAGVAGLMMLAVAAVSASTPAVAGATAAGIPAVVFSAYLAASANPATVTDTCAVDWPVIAGIWKQESDHAQMGGAVVEADGQVTPPIYGPVLDGTTPGTEVVSDTDGGVLDGDPNWDRAIGPAQFLPASWQNYGQDGNGDGTADPQNVFDAAASTVDYLCLRTPGDYDNPDDLTRALYGYNNSARYVDTVLEWIAYYRAFTIGTGEVTANGYYAFPLPTDTVTVDGLGRSHHDYPASDLMVPEGNPVYAAHPGTVAAVYTSCPDCSCGYGVTITGHDGHRYTYCHGQAVADQIQPGADVIAGELIMASGNTGNSTAPHLHLQIRNPEGALVCPQPLLEAWWQGIGLSPVGAPTSGCTH